MHPAYSVIIFTTASGAGFGLLALLGLVGAAHGPASSFWFGATSLGTALLLIAGGLISSLFHLGHPERAWRAFSQWRSSWLSREGVFSVLTIGAALIFGFLWLRPDAGRAAVATSGILTAALCVVSLHCTAMIYASLPTVRQWRHWLVPPVYQAFALATGAALLHFLAQAFGRGQPVQAVLTVASLALCASLKFLYWRSIDRDKGAFTIEAATGLGSLGRVRQWEVPHTATNFIMKEMGYSVARRHAITLRQTVLGGLGGGLLMTLLALPAGGILGTALTGLTAIVALASTLIERWLFFAEAQHVSSLYYGAARA